MRFCRVRGKRIGETDMENLAVVRPKTGEIIRDIETAVDVANMLALELAINAFESEDTDTARFLDMKTVKLMIEKGLHAAGEIGRLISRYRNNEDIRICG
jgi:hypothetical protein